MKLEATVKKLQSALLKLNHRFKVHKSKCRLHQLHVAEELEQLKRRDRRRSVSTTKTKKSQSSKKISGKSKEFDATFSTITSSDSGSDSASTSSTSADGQALDKKKSQPGRRRAPSSSESDSGSDTDPVVHNLSRKTKTPSLSSRPKSIGSHPTSALASKNGVNQVEKQPECTATARTSDKNVTYTLTSASAERAQVKRNLLPDFDVRSTESKQTPYADPSQHHATKISIGAKNSINSDDNGNFNKNFYGITKHSTSTLNAAKPSDSDSDSSSESDTPSASSRSQPVRFESPNKNKDNQTAAAGMSTLGLSSTRNKNNNKSASEPRPVTGTTAELPSNLKKSDGRPEPAATVTRADAVSASNNKTTTSATGINASGTNLPVFAKKSEPKKRKTPQSKKDKAMTGERTIYTLGGDEEESAVAPKSIEGRRKARKQKLESVMYTEQSTDSVPTNPQRTPNPNASTGGRSIASTSSLPDSAIAGKKRKVPDSSSSKANKKVRTGLNVADPTGSLNSKSSNETSTAVNKLNKGPAKPKKDNDNTLAPVKASQNEPSSVPKTAADKPVDYMQWIMDANSRINGKKATNKAATAKLKLPKEKASKVNETKTKPSEEMNSVSLKDTSKSKELALAITSPDGAHSETTGPVQTQTEAEEGKVASQPQLTKPAAPVTVVISEDEDNETPLGSESDSDDSDSDASTNTGSADKKCEENKTRVIRKPAWLVDRQEILKTKEVAETHRTNAASDSKETDKSEEGDSDSDSDASPSIYTPGMTTKELQNRLLKSPVSIKLARCKVPNRAPSVSNSIASSSGSTMDSQQSSPASSHYDSGMYSCDTSAPLAFECSFSGCWEIFTSELQKIQHMKLHVNQFACKKCMKFFKTQAEISQHEREHFYDQRDSKKFKCLECDETFGEEATLQRHVAAHLKKKAVIGPSFSSSYPCPICKRRFRDTNQLNVHLAEKHGEKTKFACLTCHQKFTLRGNLRRHCLTQEHEFK